MEEDLSIMKILKGKTIFFVWFPYGKAVKFMFLHKKTRRRSSNKSRNKSAQVREHDRLFRNFRTASRGLLFPLLHSELSPIFSEGRGRTRLYTGYYFDSRKFLFHTIPHPKFPNRMHPTFTPYLKTYLLFQIPLVRMRQWK